MRVAIMQPTYLPWIGYFSLIYHSDVFVFLDDVQFARRSWQQRNKIYIKNDGAFLSVPVISKGKRDQLICSTAVNDEEDWRSRHLKTLTTYYSKYPYFLDVIGLLEKTLKSDKTLLACINMSLIADICDYLGFNTTFLKSSALKCVGNKSTRLLNICNMVGATTYLSPMGSMDYIEQEGIFRDAGLTVKYQDYKPIPYETYPNQRNTFIPNLSVVDLLFSYGKHCMVHFESGSFA